MMTGCYVNDCRWTGGQAGGAKMSQEDILALSSDLASFVLEERATASSTASARRADTNAPARIPHASVGHGGTSLSGESSVRALLRVVGRLFAVRRS